MTIHDEAGQTINVVRNYNGVRIIIECSDEVCEPVEFAMSPSEWAAFVAQGFKAMAEVGE